MLFSVLSISITLEMGKMMSFFGVPKSKDRSFQSLILWVNVLKRLCVGKLDLDLPK